MRITPTNVRSKITVGPTIIGRNTHKKGRAISDPAFFQVNGVLVFPFFRHFEKHVISSNYKITAIACETFTPLVMENGVWE